MDEVAVIRRKGKPWIFKKTDAGFYECVKKYRYRLMIGTIDCKPIWIGRIIGNNIFTFEREIGAMEVLFAFGRYVFDT